MKIEPLTEENEKSEEKQITSDLPDDYDTDYAIDHETESPLQFNVNQSASNEDRDSEFKGNLSKSVNEMAENNESL